MKLSNCERVITKTHCQSTEASDQLSYHINRRHSANMILNVWGKGLQTSPCLSLICVLVDTVQNLFVFVKISCLSFFLIKADWHIKHILADISAVNHRSHRVTRNWLHHYETLSSWFQPHFSLLIYFHSSACWNVIQTSSLCSSLSSFSTALLRNLGIAYTGLKHKLVAWSWNYKIRIS